MLKISIAVRKDLTHFSYNTLMNWQKYLPKKYLFQASIVTVTAIASILNISLISFHLILIKILEK